MTIIRLIPIKHTILCIAHLPNAPERLLLGINTQLSIDADERATTVGYCVDRSIFDLGACLRSILKFGFPSRLPAAARVGAASEVDCTV